MIEEKLLYRKDHLYYTAEVHMQETGRYEEIEVTNLRETPFLEWPTVKMVNELENIRKVMTGREKQKKSMPIKAVYVYWSAKDKVIVFPNYPDTLLTLTEDSLNDSIEVKRTEVICEDYTQKIGEHWSWLELEDIVAKGRAVASHVATPSPELKKALNDRAMAARILGV